MPGVTRRDIERAIPGTVLADPSYFPHVAAKVRPEYFSDGLSRRIFEAQTKLYREGIEPGTANVLAFGGLAREDVAEVVTLSLLEDRYNVQRLALRLCELEAQERLAKCREAAGKEPDVFNALDIFRGGIASAESVILGAIRRTKADSIDQVLARAAERKSGRRKLIATSFPTVDAMLGGGLSDAGLSFVGGYAGEGKTSWAECAAVNVARGGLKVDFYEGEMLEDELHDRAARMFYGGDLLRWLEEYERLPLEFVMLSDRTPGRLLSAVEYSAANGVRLVVVDYLQAFALQERETDRHYLAIKNLSAQLRSLILRHGEQGRMLHVMALSNLNRTESGSGRPGLASLYGSSGLAHDCTEAFMIYSDSSESARLQEAHTGERTAIVEIVKARNGQRGPVSFTFNGASQVFREK